MSEFAHVPVFLDRVLELFAPVLSRPEAVAVDATLGLGGHAEAMLAAFPGLVVIGLDRDGHALERAMQRLAPYGSRVIGVHTVYDGIGRAIESAGVARVDAVLFDLGVSSMQLDEAERGFAYAQDAPLDMRMDQDAPMRAADILNTYSADELARILREYGEERFAARIANAIVRERSVEPFTTSARLVELLRKAIPAATRRTGGHPAKRTFQALRIEVNDELGVLERALPAALAVLRLRGRIVVLSYHSLEDKIAKRVLTAASTPTAPPDLPVVPEQYAPRFALLTRGAQLPSEQEIARNPRAASARLRAAERVREAA